MLLIILLSFHLAELTVGLKFPVYKTLSGRLPEFDSVKPVYSPDVTSVSKSCLIQETQGTLEISATNGTWKKEVPVDSWPFTVTVCTQLPDMIHTEFSFNQRQIKQCYDNSVNTGINTGEPFACRNFVFCNGSTNGTLTIQLSCDVTVCPDGDFPLFVEVSFSSSSFELVTKVTTPNPIMGEPVTIEARLQDTSGENINLIPIISAVIDVVFPDGHIVSKVMDVLKGGDIIGKFIPSFKSSNSKLGGNTLDLIFDVITKVTGISEKYGKIVRTISNILIPAVKSIFFDSNAFVSSPYTHFMSNSEKVQFTIPVRVLDSEQHSPFRYYVEVWGTINKTKIPVCWISGLTDISVDNSTQVEQYLSGHFNIEMDTIWMEMAGAKFPVELRNLTLEETVGFIELEQSDVMEVCNDPLLLLWTPKLQKQDIKVTTEMKEGYNPFRNPNTDHQHKASNGTMLLVHGYCAGGPTFPTKDFTNYEVFADYKQSRDLNLFAQMIKDFAAAKEIDVFSIIAHSQGGMAALHLLTYYCSGLDMATNSGRKIQTVGTPWQGSPLVGLFASAAKSLGFGCGTNADLTVNVAARWLSKIPCDKQKEVYYYTTEKGQGPKPCSLVTNEVLDEPNDGIVELKRAQLPCGIPVDHSLGECHTAGMAYPPQCHNAIRNSEMDKNAAR